MVFGGFIFFWGLVFFGSVVFFGNWNIEKEGCIRGGKGRKPEFQDGTWKRHDKCSS